ncbi:MAG TPA: amidohydrolase family protein [Patescibacteria group bacterium]|nr:amidohydrolase family protein [Patescibacteria group bacterium]
MRTITLEEHFASHAFLDGPGRMVKEHSQQPGSSVFGVAEKLWELGEKRIAEMDAAGIDVQVLSLTVPGVEQLDASEAVPIARDENDLLAEAVRKHPDRFAGFAALPTPAPEKAAEELERTVREYGFKGALINGHARGRYLDDPFFSPILERAEALNVPIYVHPTRPPKAVIEASYAGFAPAVVDVFASYGWGWHIETAVHVIRLAVGGVFDRFPKLQIIIGHLGEGLPFMLPRMAALKPVTKNLRRPVTDYFRENVHYTFGGFNFTSTFLNLLMEVGVDRIMFSTDYPYAPMDQARSFLEGLPVSPSDREKIAHGNAERLLGM